MATTLTKTKTGLNWGSEGITSGFTAENDPSNSFYGNYKDFTDNSFTIKMTGSTLRRYFIINKNKVLGNEATLTKVVANFSGYVSSNRSHKILLWGNGNSICTESSAEDSLEFTTSLQSGYSLETSELTLNSNGNYAVYLGTYNKSIFANTAYFSDVSFDLYYTIPAYTLTVISNNADYGIVSGGGAFESGATATITATPKKGYRFVRWEDGNTSATRTVTVSADKTYTAIFEKLGADNTYTDGEKCSEVWIDGEKCSQLWIDGVKVFG